MKPRIAIDAMGGDEGVPVMLAGAALARHRHDSFKFLLVGDEPKIKAALDNHPKLRAASEILHAEDVVTGDDIVDTGSDWTDESNYTASDAEMVKDIRRYLFVDRSVPRADVSISGYWRTGMTEDGWQSFKHGFVAGMEAEEAAALGQPESD